MTQEEKRAWAQAQLRIRQAELGRAPHKDDFDEVTRARIKAFLGPWPRALEAAGLKDVQPAQKKSKKHKATPPEAAKTICADKEKGENDHEKNPDPGCCPDACNGSCPGE